MIRVVIAVVVATAILGVALPAAERAERDRNAALAVDELETVAETAAVLVAENDPADPGSVPATAEVVVDPPAGTVSDGGHVAIDGERLRWVPKSGPEQSVTPDVGIVVAEPLRITDRTRLRLSLVDGDGGQTVEVARASGRATGPDARVEVG